MSIISEFHQDRWEKYDSIPKTPYIKHDGSLNTDVGDRRTIEQAKNIVGENASKADIVNTAVELQKNKDFDTFVRNTDFNSPSNANVEKMVKKLPLKKVGIAGAAAAALIAAGLAVKHFVIDKKQAQGQEKAGLNTAA